MAPPWRKGREAMRAGVAYEPFELLRLYIAAVPVLLFCILGTSIATLASYETGWAYYRQRGFRSFLAGPTGVTYLHLNVGYVRGSNSISSRLHALLPAAFAKYAYLREVSEAGQVFGGIVAGVQALSILGVLAFFVLWLLVFFRPKRGSATKHPLARHPGLYMHRLAWVAGTFALVNLACCLVLYILIAIGTARYTQRNLGTKLVPWPDWAFFTALVQALLWAGLWAFSAMERAREKRLTASTLPETQLTPPGAGAPVQTAPTQSP